VKYQNPKTDLTVAIHCNDIAAFIRLRSLQHFTASAARADPGFQFGGRSSAEGARIEAPQWGWGKFFNFGVSKCVFWCTLWPTWIWFCRPSSCYFLLMLCADLLTMDDYDNYNW